MKPLIFQSHDSEQTGLLRIKRPPQPVSPFSSSEAMNLREHTYQREN